MVPTDTVMLFADASLRAAAVLGGRMGARRVPAPGVGGCASLCVAVHPRRRRGGSRDGDRRARLDRSPAGWHRCDFHGIRDRTSRTNTPSALAAHTGPTRVDLPSSDRDTAVSTTVAPPDRPLDWAAVLLTAWLAGATAVVLYMLLGTAAVWRMRRRAVALNAAWVDEARALAEAFDVPPVAFMESTMTGMPIVCGVWRPAIVMPRGTAEWPVERLRVAVLHELAHIRRRDCLTQVFAQVVCALYWFNPLAWVAARRLRAERERACDDFVLAAGTRGSAYAGHLLEIARAMGPRFPLLAGAGVAMAHRSQLEGRLMAILDPAIRRSSTFYTRAAALTAMVVVSIPAAALRLQEAAPPPPDIQLSTPVTVSAPLVVQPHEPASQRLERSRLAPAQAEASTTAEVSIVGNQVVRLDDVNMQDWLAFIRESQDSLRVLAEQTGGIAVERRKGRALDRALLEAAEEGDTQGISDLLLAGADVNGAVPGDGSPLIAAARRGRLDVVRLLLDRGADPNMSVSGDGNPIIMAASQGHAAVVQLLLDRGADPNMGVSGDGNAIIMAAREGHAAVVELLMQRGAHINQAVDGDENTLIQASASGRLEMVKLLVSRGADVNARFLVRRARVIQEETEVFDNLSRGRVVPVRRLDTREEWRSALSMARQGGHEAVVAFLLSVGAQE